jgi:hypothetical protein
MEHERVVVVDRSGEVVWQWNASSYYDAPADPTRTDWLHVNDLDYLGDGRFLVSVRNANQLLVVDRREGVVEVVNEDRDPAVLDEQHNPQYLGPGRVLVADSGNDRVVELRRNDSGEWQVAWQLRGAGGIGFEWPRDADLLPNGNVLVTDTFNDRLVEVTRNGSLVWSTSTRPIPYEADRNGTEYPRAISNVTGGPASGPTAATGDRTTDLPLLPEAYGGFVGTVPVPYWFGLPKFVGLILTLLAVIGGLVSSVVARVR